MVMKPTNAYKRIRVSYVHSMPHACFRTLVDVLRDVHCEEYITKRFELMHHCEILMCKILISYICALVQNVL